LHSAVYKISHVYFFLGEEGPNFSEILQKVSPKVSPKSLAKFHELKISTKPQHYCCGLKWNTRWEYNADIMTFLLSDPRCNLKAYEEDIRGLIFHAIRSGNLQLAVVKKKMVFFTTRQCSKENYSSVVMKSPTSRRIEWFSCKTFYYIFVYVSCFPYLSVLFSLMRENNDIYDAVTFKLCFYSITWSLVYSNIPWNNTL